ncbi:MAG: TolC family protein [Rhodocyclaceae bacterium]|nr:TolC family protein [Rhodocyclaceae bacterium]
MSVIAIWLVAQSACAEGLTLNAAFRLALDGHPLRQQKLSGIAAAGDDVKAAEWKRYPTVTGENSHNVQQSSNAANLPQNGTNWRLEQPLWTGGRISSEIGGAESRQRIAEFSLGETEQDLLLRVAQSFSDCLRLKERLDVAKDNVAEHERLFALIDRRRLQQVGSEADVALAHARLQQARTELMTLKATLASARTTLGQLVGAEIQDDFVPAAAPDGGRPDAAAVAAAARAYSPTLHRLEAELQQAKTDVDSRKSALMPQLSARYERLGGSDSTTNIPYDRVMLVVAFQPGAGLSSVSQMDASMKRVQAAQSAIEAGERDATERALNQLNEANSFAEQLAPTLDYAQATRDVMASYLRQYTAGRKSWLDVLNTQRELAQARYAAADVNAGVLVSSLKLDALTGRLTRASVLEGYPGNQPISR